MSLEFKPYKTKKFQRPHICIKSDKVITKTTITVGKQQAAGFQGFPSKPLAVFFKALFLRVSNKAFPRTSTQALIPPPPQKKNCIFAFSISINWLEF